MDWIINNKDWLFSGVAVAVITAIIKLSLLWQSRRRATTGSYLVGRWNCTWTFVLPAGRQPLTDSITISSVADGVIEGRGENPDIGAYRVQGRVWEHVVTLQYYGSNTKEDLVGVVLLKREPLRSKLAGEWLQLIATNEIAKGTTSWEKVLT